MAIRPILRTFSACLYRSPKRYSDDQGTGKLYPRRSRQINSRKIPLVKVQVEMEPQSVTHGTDVAKHPWNWKQRRFEEKETAVNEELQRLSHLPPASNYASHRLRVLNKVKHLLSLQRTTAQDEELELLFAGLQI